MPGIGVRCLWGVRRLPSLAPTAGDRPQGFNSADRVCLTSEPIISGRFKPGWMWNSSRPFTRLPDKEACRQPTCWRFCWKSSFARNSRDFSRTPSRHRLPQRHPTEQADPISLRAFRNTGRRAQPIMSTSTNRRQLRKEYEIAEELADGVHQLAARRGQSVSDVLAAVMQAGLHELGNPAKYNGAFPAEDSGRETLLGHGQNFVSEVDPPARPTVAPAKQPGARIFRRGGSTGGGNSVSA